MTDQFLDGMSLKPGPLFEYMRMPCGEYGERITNPDGTAECWINGKPCEPDKFEAMLKVPEPKASLWKVTW